jgi:Peptidase family M28
MTAPRSTVILGLLATLVLGTGALGLGVPSEDEGDPGPGLKTIDKAGIEEHLAFLASPTLEGRDSPSRGLMLAAERVAQVFAAAGLTAAPDSMEVWKEVPGKLPGLEGGESPPAWSIPTAGAPAEPVEAGRTSTQRAGGTYLRPFALPYKNRRGKGLQRPVPAKCDLVLTEDGGAPVNFTYGADYVPLAGQAGTVAGELAWVGFGIKSRKQKYDALRGLKLKGKVAMLVEGDPRTGKNFGGPELTAEASIWNKLAALEEAGAVGVIVVRRDPERPKWMKQDPVRPPLGYRYTWASWNPPSTDRQRGAGLPAIEVSPACAEALLGHDPLALAKKLDRGSAPKKTKIKDRHVSFKAVLEDGDFTLPNVVGVLVGRDPALAHEYVIVGAHMDHIGVGVRGRAGLGADDNGSGTSALLEVVEAMAAAPPRRSVLFTVFSGEEDGLFGSKDIAQNLPVPKANVVAMVNLDMIGRGDTRDVYCLGFAQNPGMEKVVRRAQDLGRTGIKRVKRCDDRGLFQRSDHYSFHAVGIPSVFFFENFPLEQNRDYHTWRDTFEGVDLDKVTYTARLAFCTAWLLAEQDERLPAPKG